MFGLFLQIKRHGGDVVVEGAAELGEGALELLDEVRTASTRSKENCSPASLRLSVAASVRSTKISPFSQGIVLS